MTDRWEGHAGDTFFCLSGHAEHLFIVLSEPRTYPSEGHGNRLCLVSVNFTSIHEGQIFDPACIVEPGDHPFIRHRSYVFYQKIQILDYEHVCRCVNQGIYRAGVTASPELLAKIIAGIQQSSFIPRKFKILFHQ